MNIAYGQHEVSESDIEAVTSVLRSTHLTMGSVVDALEAEIALFTATKKSVAVSSGTAALHCAYSAFPLKGKEVITTPMTFVSTASTAVLQGAKIIFSDIDISTGNINPDCVESCLNSKTSLVTCVDYAGNPSPIRELKKITIKNNVFLIEDASHALGTKYFDEIIGSQSDLTIFSFFPTKNITSGEGGAIVSNNIELLNKVRSFKMHGLVRDKKQQMYPNEGIWHQEVHKFGLNYRLSELHAALALSQLKRIEHFKQIRQGIFDFYTESFSNVAEIKLPKNSQNSEPFWHLFPIQVPKEIRKKFFEYLRSNGIIVQVNYIPVYWHPVFQDMGYKKGLCPNAEEFYKREISLPIHTKLIQSDLDFIVERVCKFFK